MKIENQTKTELLLNLVHEGKLDLSMFSKLQNTEFIVPFSQDKSADNRVCYHLGDYITLAEYLNMKSLNFEELKEVILLCARGFLAIKNSGGLISNIVPDINHVFVNPVSMELKYIYLPVFLELNPDAFVDLMKQIIFFAKAEDAELIIGTVVLNLRKYREKDGDVEAFIRKLQEADNNVKVIEKEIQVDRIVEKVIEKPVKQRTDLGGSLLFYTFIYSFSMILLPYVACSHMDENLISEPKLVNISLCLLSILITVVYSMKKENERFDDKTVITMQPQEKKNEEIKKRM